LGLVFSKKSYILVYSCFFEEYSHEDWKNKESLVPTALVYAFFAPTELRARLHTSSVLSLLKDEDNPIVKKIIFDLADHFGRCDDLTELPYVLGGFYARRTKYGFSKVFDYLPKLAKLSHA